MNGSRPRSGSAADDSSDDEFDPASFQAELDASVHSSRSLVQSWLPSNLGSEWDDAFSAQKGAVGLQGLKDAMRPARLGLGAQPAAAHKQLAEDRKIKNRLLGKNPRALGDEGAVVKLQNGNRDAADASGSDDDEEESRAGAIGKKGKGTSNGTQNKKDYINPFLLPKAKPSTPLKSDIHAAADVGGKALFNAPSPAKPAPLARASPQSSASTSISKAAPLVAASAFYGGGGGHDGAAGAQLTKNQRKKERQREKAAALKRQREEESRLEEETEQRKRIKTGDTVQGKRSADGNDELAEANMDATERGVETLRASSGSDDDGGGEALSPSRSQADSATAAAGGASSPGKRKKKKKKKASVGAGSGSGAVADGPLLNLGWSSTERDGASS